jgi:hypothetical protein
MPTFSKNIFRALKMQTVKMLMRFFWVVMPRALTDFAVSEEHTVFIFRVLKM